MYTLGTAAKATGLAKSTIHRAIKSGKVSARHKDGNSYEIDPAELHRVFPALGQGVAENGSDKGSAERSATGEGNGRNGGVPDRETDVRLARVEAELEGLKQVLELERKRADELRSERDRWAAQAERLALVAPVAVVSGPGQGGSATGPKVRPRTWWPFRRAM